MVNFSDYSQPLYPQTYPAASGLKLTWVDDKTITIGAGLCRDSSNKFDMSLSSTLTVSLLSQGVNGVDILPITTSRWYSVFLIADPVTGMPTAAVLSLFSTPDVPVLPSGPSGNAYGIYKKIGWIRVNSAGNIVNFLQTGNNNNRYYQWDTEITVLNNGSDTTFTDVNISGGCPPIQRKVTLSCTYTPTTAASLFSIKTRNGTSGQGTCPLELKGIADGIVTKFPSLNILTDYTSGTGAYISYRVSVGTDILAIFANGFEDQI